MWTTTTMGTWTVMATPRSGAVMLDSERATVDPQDGDGYTTVDPQDSDSSKMMIDLA
jgi:hypothetical protein